MDEINLNDYYSFLKEEKKAQMTNDFQNEIDNQKVFYTLSNEQHKDIDNNNYRMKNLKNYYFKNRKIQPKFENQYNDEIINSEFEKSLSDNGEGHIEILNKAKNVLDQVHEDINKFSEVYGIEAILPRKESIPSNKNTISDYYYNNNKYNDNFNSNKIDRDNYIYSHKNLDEDENEVENDVDADPGVDSEDNINNLDENNYIDNDYIENHYYNKNTLEDDNDIDIDNDSGSIEDECNEEFNNYKITDKNKSYKTFNKFNKNKKYQIEPPNETLSYYYYKNRDEENGQKDNINYLYDKIQGRNGYTIENRSTNKSNYLTHNTNSSISKYNFDNLLNYEKDNLKRHFKHNSYLSKKTNFNDINHKDISKIKSLKKTHLKTISNDRKDNDNDNGYIRTISITNKYSHKKKNNKKRNLNVSSDNIFSGRYSQKFENMKRKLEIKFAEEHPFKPKINKKYNKKKIAPETEEERYNRLSRPKILDINEKKRIKNLEELKRLSENNKVNSTYRINPITVSNRLYNNHQKMEIKKNKMKQNYEEIQNKLCSFNPEINDHSKILMDKYQKKSLYERNEEFEKNKIENIYKIRKRIENEQKEKYRPKINENSRKLALMNRINNKDDSDNSYEDIYERLYNENIHQIKDINNIGDNEMKECTFSPNLNIMTNYDNSFDNDFDKDDDDAYNDDMGENVKDFLKRQEKYEKIKKEKLKKNILDSCTNYTFKPEINSTSNILAKCNPERFTENSSDKYSRLYEYAQKMKQKKEKLINEINSQYNFVPKINEFSKYIGKKPEKDELNSKNKNKNKIVEKVEKYDFKPQIIGNKKYKKIKSNYKNDENIFDRINEEVNNKNKKIKLMQKMKEDKDIEQCNFSPTINKRMPDFESNQPMYMKGMAKYLEQMEKARQAKRDKEQREKEVFITGEGWSKNKGVTVPKPFKLSYQNNKKNEMTKRIRDNEEKKEGSKSKINESKNRAIIKKLLSEN